MRDSPSMRVVWPCALLLVVAVSLVGRGAGACEPAPHSRLDMPSPIDAVGCNSLDALTDSPLLVHGAFVLSSTMAFSGADHAVRVFTQKNLASPAYGDAAVYMGYLAPSVVASGLWAIGLATRDRSGFAGAGAAALQALAVTAAATGALKWATGRPFPMHGGDPKDPRRLEHPSFARELHPFALDGSLAWPSGHASTSLAVASSLAAYYSDAPWVGLLGYPIAGAIGIGMIVGDHHWASDVLAGAMLGHAAGYAIGRDFRRMFRGDPGVPAHTRLRLAPMFGEVRGVMVVLE